MRDDESGRDATSDGEAVDFDALARLLPQRYPAPADRPRRRLAGRGTRLVARKGVTAGEPFFAGTSLGGPSCRGSSCAKRSAQASALLVARSEPPPPPGTTLALTGLERVRFRQPVVPGDVLEIDVGVLERKADAWRFRGRVRVGTVVVAETDFALAVHVPVATAIHPTAVLAAGAALGIGVVVGPYAVIGPHVQIGDRTTIGPHAVLDGRTTIGADNRIFQFASVGAEPQDLKYRGEPSRLVIGDRNIIREFSTLNPGTQGGGMVTTIGSDNLVMNYAHVGHDSQVGNRCILANSSALAGHVTLEDFVFVGGLAAVHQFVRVGESALLGGWSNGDARRATVLQRLGRPAPSARAERHRSPPSRLRRRPHPIHQARVPRAVRFELAGRRGPRALRCGARRLPGRGPHAGLHRRLDPRPLSGGTRRRRRRWRRLSASG
jgi:3-hydroxymyristoyl/3-hydroxydecanoyl-(acyl carrier protein) dehydratase/acetyltransferase-like isoleucine patch superfamily enzyme